ncbi:MAG: anaerobic ribonucleoside-triphosphate reductase activating protein [Eubacteriales bacterium]|nr:anaerobic ribonucleoside-triphosphate reductase activating protein [Eubacteriales bacterium]
MRIAGFVKNSFVDYPGYIAAAVFVQGCNMDCWYCHNKQLWKSGALVDEALISDFLGTHQGFIDGVVISGGEPTLQSDLKRFILNVKEKGYRVKLDTNGLRPDVVRDVMGHVDYIAMDIKAPPGGISRVVSFDLDEAPIWQTADMLIRGDTDYEFRTTLMPLLDISDIVSIAKRIKSAKKYAIQQYRKTDNVGISPEPLGADAVHQAVKAAKLYIENVVVRGL